MRISDLSFIGNVVGWLKLFSNSSEEEEGVFLAKDETTFGQKERRVCPLKERKRRYL
jgi:hypothetical protein